MGRTPDVTCEPSHSWTVATDKATPTQSITVTFQRMCQVAVTAAGGTGTVTLNPPSGRVSCGEGVAVTVRATDGYCIDRVDPAPLPLRTGRTIACETTRSWMIQTSTATPVVAFIVRFEAAPQPKATLVLGPTSISENGGSATVTATLSGPAPAGGASLTVSTRGGSGYSLSPDDPRLTFTEGATSSSGTVTITAEHDADTNNETVTVSATVASGAITAPADVTLTIRDDDGSPPPPTPTPTPTPNVHAHAHAHVDAHAHTHVDAHAHAR